MEKSYLEYNLSLKTPQLAKTSSECTPLFVSGLSENKIDLVFIPVNYSQEEINDGLFEKDVKSILFDSQKESTSIEKRISFFEIPVFNQSSAVFNMFLAKYLSQSPSQNKLIAIAKSCGFDKKEDVIILVHNSVLGMGYAEGVGTGNTIYLFKSGGFVASATLFAHELAHLFGMDEEYYMLNGGVTEPKNVQNCDYGNLTCNKWCAGVDAEKTTKIHAAKEKYDTCTKILADKNEGAWKDFCLTLDLKTLIENYVISGGSYAGAKSQEEFCAFPLSKAVGYTCYAGTFWSLDRDESLNLGINCKEGYQCYYGCGTKYEYTRSTFIGIMGGGAMGEAQYLYQQKEQNSGEKVLPDFSPAANKAIKEYLSKYQ